MAAATAPGPSALHARSRSRKRRRLCLLVAGRQLSVIEKSLLFLLLAGVGYSGRSGHNNGINMLGIGLGIQVVFPSIRVVSAIPRGKLPGKIPEATSSALKRHRRLYAIHPPHDASLYDVLQVMPNATLAQIQKAYRRKSRDLHPDKVRLRKLQRARRKQEDLQRERQENNDAGPDFTCSDNDNDSDSDEEECENELTRLREAYEVLKDDSTRLPYHRFGLVDTDTAASLLTGGKIGGGTQTSEQKRLLRLMGYDSDMPTSSCASLWNHHQQHHTHLDQSSASRHERRVSFLAANIVETIRPLVEGSITQQDLTQYIASECDELKSSPLGAQIIRCVGRAYRYCGQNVLRQHRRRVGGSPFRAGLDLSDKVRAKVRDAKNIMDAAFTSGKLVLTEQKTKTGSVEKTVKEALPAVEYHNLGALEGGDGDDADLDALSSEEIRVKELEKTQAAVIGTLQIEALWKIVKIELDRTIQDACDRILDGDYFFFPSHQSHTPSYARDEGYSQQKDGWIGQTGEAIDAEIGKLRAAAALVLVGDTMVQCSKENTAWVD